MQYNVDNPEQYVNQLPDDRKEAIGKLRKSILDNLPEGFIETVSYGMIGYVVPHTLFPKGYHCNPELPLPFMNIASQKNHIALYHMGIYGNKELLEWFVTEYTTSFKSKLDMGKGCFRFKKPELIPYHLIGELTSKISVTDWIKMYEQNRIRKPSDQLNLSSQS
jgi:uncharacterized protein YdhG (YjbR/CyaY superfamily)